MSYINATKIMKLLGWVSDSFENLQIQLYSDADFAGCLDTSRSTNGVFFALVGPDTFFPLSATSKRQTCVSHSTPEAEIVAADHGVRVEALPAIALWKRLPG